METPAPPEPVTLPIRLIDYEDLPVLFANALLLQRQGVDEFIVTIGQAAPVILGSPEQQRDAIQEMGAIPVRAIARIAVTEARLEEFIRILQDALDQSRTTYGKAREE